jgi:hypothetical protein
MKHAKAPAIVKDELQNLLRGLAKDLNKPDLRPQRCSLGHQVRRDT